MVKALGSEIKKCYYAVNDTLKFPCGNLFFEASDLFEDTDVDELNDDQKYELSDLGYWYEDVNSSEKSFNTVFSAWKKQQTSVDLVITIYKVDEQKIRQLLLDNGIKINK